MHAVGTEEAAQAPEPSSTPKQNGTSGGAGSARRGLLAGAMALAATAAIGRPWAALAQSQDDDDDGPDLEYAIKLGDQWLPVENLLPDPVGKLRTSDEPAVEVQFRMPGLPNLIWAWHTEVTAPASGASQQQSVPGKPQQGLRDVQIRQRNPALNKQMVLVLEKAIVQEVAVSTDGQGANTVLLCDVTFVGLRVRRTA